jgi:L-iditol 2-dehydrogenase
MFELYLEKPGHLSLKEIASVRSPKDHEARVKVIYGGICGSDLRVLRGTIPYAVYPCRPGHEILGIVTEAGKNSPHRPGTRVVSFPNTYCGTCQFCRQGKTNICTNKKSFGVTINGLFADEILIDSEFLVAVPVELPDERAILTEPLAVNVHALQRADITKGTSVAVVGCGTEGLLAVALLNYIGAEITVVDINPAKMAKAQTFNPTIQALLPAQVKGRVFDVVIEAAGVKAAIEQAFLLVKPGGALITLGITSDQVNFPSLHVTRSEMTIYGSIIYTKDDFRDALRFLKDPRFNVSPVLSKIVPFAEYDRAFADALSGNFSKIVLDFQNNES